MQLRRQRVEAKVEGQRVVHVQTSPLVHQRLPVADALLQGGHLVGPFEQCFAHRAHLNHGGHVVGGPDEARRASHQRRRNRGAADLLALGCRREGELGQGCVNVRQLAEAGSVLMALLKRAKLRSRGHADKMQAVSLGSRVWLQAHASAARPRDAVPLFAAMSAGLRILTDTTLQPGAASGTKSEP